MPAAVHKRLEIEGCDPAGIMARLALRGIRLSFDMLGGAAFRVGSAGAMTGFTANAGKMGSGRVVFKAALFVAGGMAFVAGFQFLGGELRRHDGDAVP